MKRSYLAASIAAIAGAVNFDLDIPDVSDGKPELHIVYPDNIDTNLVRVSRDLYPMAFRWPERSPRCGATMITPQVALTAAHCVGRSEDNSNNLNNLDVELTDGNGNLTTYDIVDIRANNCWWTEANSGWTRRMAADIAFLILDRPIENAVEGKHYVKVWNEDEGDIVGRTFTLAGWGASGELRPDGSENHLDTRM